jgi:hypothetical protein
MKLPYKNKKEGKKGKDFFRRALVNRITIKLHSCKKAESNGILHSIPLLGFIPWGD